MNGSASGQLVTFIALLSHSIFFPAREATFPSSTISVSGPAYPKWLPVALPVLHAWIHSAWWPSEFGIVGSGGLYSAKSFSGSSLYRSPYEPARYSLPFSPISSEPLSEDESRQCAPMGRSRRDQVPAALIFDLRFNPGALVQ